MDEEYKHFIRENLASVRERIRKAKEKRSSCPAGEEVKLLAASKTVDAETLNFAAHELGLTCIGENKVQELCDKYPLLKRDELEIHFIGTLQTNKVKYITDKVSLIHSLDRQELAKEISKRSQAIRKIMPVLAEVNIAEEPGKSGLYPRDVRDFIEYVSGLEGIRLTGLMTMAPAGCSRNEYLSYFSEVRQMFLSLKEQNIPGVTMETLSMGMSGSYEEAVECGANLVRIGSAIFGKRQYGNN